MINRNISHTLDILLRSSKFYESASLKDSPEDYSVLIKLCIYILLMQTMYDE